MDANGWPEAGPEEVGLGFVNDPGPWLDGVGEELSVVDLVESGTLPVAAAVRRGRGRSQRAGPVGVGERSRRAPDASGIPARAGRTTTRHEAWRPRGARAAGRGLHDRGAGRRGGHHGGGRHGGPGRGRHDEGDPFEVPPERGRRWEGFDGGPPFGRRGRGFGHRPHVMRGDVRAATLALLAEEPLNGYQIIQQIGERSGGVWWPSSGSVYPGLQLLEDEGLIRAEEVAGRRRFALTDAGRAYVDGRREELAGVWAAVAGRVDDAAVELRDLFEQLGAAVAHVARAGGDAEVAEARRLLIETRRRLYRILAGPEADAGMGGRP